MAFSEMQGYIVDYFPNVENDNEGNNEVLREILAF